MHECEKFDRAHQVIAFPATIEQDEDLPVVSDDEEEQADQDIQSRKTIQPVGVKELTQPEGAKENERTTPLQIGFNEA